MRWYYDTLTASRSIKTWKLSAWYSESISSSPPERYVCSRRYPMAFMDMFVIFSTLQILPTATKTFFFHVFICIVNRWFVPAKRRCQYICQENRNKCMRSTSAVPKKNRTIFFVIKKLFSHLTCDQKTKKNLAKMNEKNGFLFLGREKFANGKGESGMWKTRERKVQTGNFYSGTPQGSQIFFVNWK